MLLKPYFHGRIMPHRRAVLRRQGFAVHARRTGWRADAWPHRAAGLPRTGTECPRTTPRASACGRSKFRTRRTWLSSGLNLVEQRAQRVSDPRHHHRPGFHAAEAEDALFERRELQDLFDRELARLGDFAFHGDRSRARSGSSGRASRAGPFGCRTRRSCCTWWRPDSEFSFSPVVLSLLFTTLASLAAWACPEGDSNSRPVRKAAGTPARNLRRFRKTDFGVISEYRMSAGFLMSILIPIL